MGAVPNAKKMVAACLQLSGGGWRLLKNLGIVISGTWWLCSSAKMQISCMIFWRPHIAASYGMDRLASQQYKKAQEEDILTPDQEEAQHLPGPFSYAEYVGGLLDESFWGDHGVPAGHLYDVASHHHCFDC